MLQSLPIVELDSLTQYWRLKMVGASAVKRHERVSIYTVEGFADTQTVHLDSGSIDTETAFIVIDISDTTNWKHTLTDHIVLHAVTLQVDPDATFLGDIKLGFLTNVDETNGDFNQIIDIGLAKKSDLIVQSLGFTGGFHLQTSTHFGPITANSTLFQNDVSLAGPNGATSFPSGPGDLALIIGRSAGAVNVSVTIIYETVGA